MTVYVLPTHISNGILSTLFPVSDGLRDVFFGPALVKESALPSK